MKKSKIILLIFAFVILLGSLSLTYTYFVSEEKSKSIITFGNLKLKLIEMTLKNNEYVNVNDNDSIDITNINKLSRVVKVENVGNNPFYVRLSVIFKGTDKNNKEINASNLIEMNIDENWEYKDGYYYYKKEVFPNEFTTELMKEIKFDNKKILKKYQGSKFNLKIMAQAVQSENNNGDALKATGWPD